MIVDVVMLHYRDLKRTKRCLNSVFKEEASFRKIIIINNDNSVDLKKEIKNKKIEIINSGKNVGFSKGVNRGIKTSLKNKADAILLLNNDTEVKEGMIKELKNNSSEKNAGIIAPLAEFKIGNKKYFDCGGYISKYFGTPYHKNVSKKPREKLISTDFVSVCLLVRREVYEEIGFLDEGFFLYYEDVDFCIRAKNAGFKIFVDTSSLIYHESDSRFLDKKTIFYLISSGKKFYLKYFLTYPLGIISVIRNIIVFSLKSPQNLPVITKALIT